MALESWQIAALPGASETPPASPPPQMPPQPPSPPRSSATQIQSDLRLHYIKPRRRWVLPLLIVIAVAIIVTGVILLVQKHRNDPSVLFDQALTQSLSTSSITETRANDNDATVTALDVSKPKTAKLGTLTTKNLGADTYVKGFGTMQNTYLAFGSDPAKQTNTPTRLLDQWIAVRKDGNLPISASQTPLFTLSDPRYQLLQPWIFGNFDSKTRGDLLKQIKSTKLYSFAAKDVKQVTMDNQLTYVYSLTLDGTKLAAYETKAGAAYGISPTDTTSLTGGLLNTKIPVHLYIQKSTHQITRIDTVTNGIPTTTTFRARNNTKVSAEPTARFTYTEYLAQLGS